jgi:hypothetical protein
MVLYNIRHLAQGSVDAFEAFTCAYITTSVVYGFSQVLFGRCNCDSEKAGRSDRVVRPLYDPFCYATSCIT